LKGFSKDFIFEITLNGVKNPNSLTEDEMKMLYNLITANLTIKNINEEKFNIEENLKMEIVNEDYDLEPINKNEDVNKNFMRVHAVEIMDEAQILADQGNYEAGELMLENMNNDLLMFADNDDIFKGMQQNCSKQKDMLKNEKLGINNEYNRKAFAKNMNTCFMKQEAAPQFEFDAYQNKTRSAMSKKMKGLKSGY